MLANRYFSGESYGLFERILFTNFWVLMYIERNNIPVDESLYKNLFLVCFLKFVEKNAF